MRILITADLHYDMARSRESAERIAHEVLRKGGDALVLLGDTAGAVIEPFRRCLELFDGFTGQKFLVPGNHCLWCRDGENSIERYEHVLPAVAGKAGFSVLDHEPAVLGSVGLVGSVGWYDYSFRDRSLGIPEPFYRAKLAPGAAGRTKHHRHLLDEYSGQLSQRSLSINARWMDGMHVKLGMEDAEFVEMLGDRLTRQLAALEERADTIVAFLHHLPFRELVPKDRPDRFAFAAAFLGAQQLGEILLGCKKVTRVYCGHSHWPTRHRIGHIEVVNVGSTYLEKRLEVLELT